MRRHGRWMIAALMFCLPSFGGSGLPSRTSRPAPPGVVMEALLGEYGSTDSLLTVYEQRGRLFADGLTLRQSRLRHDGGSRFVADSGQAVENHPALQFLFDTSRHGPARHALAVEFDGRRLPQRDIGAETVKVIRTAVRSDVDALRAAALHTSPPLEPAAARASDLVALAGVDPAIRFDIRYATTDNFMGFALYERAVAYLQRPAAAALARVAQSLRAVGYGLVIYDAYRPWFVTKMFWDATPDSVHIFVADPAAGSRHNRGCAVDLTLYDLATGTPVQMTGRYDEMSHRSFADYVGGSSRQRWSRDLLRKAMEEQGFNVYPPEWWHFDYRDWHEYAIGNVTFEQLAARTGSSG